MDTEAARAFGRPMEWLLGADPMDVGRSIAEALGVPASELIQAAEAWGSDSGARVESSSALGDLARTIVGAPEPLETTGLTEVRKIEPWAQRPRRLLERKLGSGVRSDPGESPLDELVQRFDALSPEDQERVLDLVRRLGGQGG